MGDISLNNILSCVKTKKTTTSFTKEIKYMVNSKTNYLVWRDVCIRWECKHTHYLPNLIQLPPFCLTEVFPCMSNKETHTICFTDFFSTSIFKQKLHLSVYYLTASIRLFCLISSINSWILRLNSRQL